MGRPRSLGVLLIAVVALVAAGEGAAEPLSVPTALVHAVSRGATNRGRLVNAMVLPVRGPAHLVPEPWSKRGRQCGTDELVGVIERASVTVQATRPGAVLGVGDLSRTGGGKLAGHRSHQSGRDGDLHYYALDPNGAPMIPDGHFAVYTSTGKATYSRAPEWNRHIPERYFDLAANWALVRALITDSQATVERIFVSRRVERWILTYAKAAGEDAELIAEAAAVLYQPSDSEAHDDHMHIRVACCDIDRALGRCRE